MRKENANNVVHVDFRRGVVHARRPRELTETMALDYLAQLRRQLQGGTIEGSLGPLLALSVLDVVGAVRGEQLGRLVGDIVHGLAGGGMPGDAVGVARGAAAAFVRGGEHQLGADFLELANSMAGAARKRRPERMVRGARRSVEQEVAGDG